MVDKIVATREFVHKHRVVITALTMGSFCLYLNRLALQQHNDFLKEHNLYDKFYSEPEL